MVDAKKYDEDALYEVAIEAGAEDVIVDDDEFILTTEAADFLSVQDGIKEAGIKPASVELTRVAKNEVAIGGRDAEKVLKLLEMLDELDDVQKVHSNADIDEDIIAEAM